MARFAMAKVEGSNPFIRFRQNPWKFGGFGKRSVSWLSGEGWCWVAAGVGGEEVGHVGE